MVNTKRIKKVKCNNCKNGKIKCLNCSGTGKQIASEYDCFHCNGLGNNTCNHCKGTMFVESKENCCCTIM